MCAWRVACIRKGGHTWRTRRAILWGSSSWDCRDFGCGGCGRNKLRKEKETRRCGEGKKRRKKVSCCCWLPLTMYKSACYHTVPSSLLPGTPGSGSPIQPGRPRFHPFLTWCKIKRFTFSSCVEPESLRQRYHHGWGRNLQWRTEEKSARERVCYFHFEWTRAQSSEKPMPSPLRGCLIFSFF